MFQTSLLFLLAVSIVEALGAYDHKVVREPFSLHEELVTCNCEQVVSLSIGFPCPLQ